MLEINRNNPDNFFYKWANVPLEQADNFAKRVWRDVNLKNLHDYIEPTKKRADMIIKSMVIMRSAICILENFREKTCKQSN